MKPHFSARLASAILGTIATTAPAAPVPITGSMVYQVDFDVLSATSTTGGNNAASTTAWADDATIPGWWLFRAGNGTPTGFAGATYLYRISDGGINPTTGWFYSAGAAGDPDRMLAAVPITAQGELSAIAVFQNTSAIPVRLTNIGYAAEVLHTNQTAGNVETLAVWWRKSASLIDLLTLTTAPATIVDFPAEVSTAPSAHFVTGWNRVREADFTYVSPSGYTPVNVRTPVSTPPASEIRIDPGEFFAIRWGNINDGGADALMGLDDVNLTFTAADVAVTGVLSNIVRSEAGTPRIPGDDTVTASMTVTGTGAVSPTGWRIAAPAALAGLTGTYGSTLSLPPLPIAEFTGPGRSVTIVIEDRGSPSVSTAVLLAAPWCRITPSVTSFTWADGGTPADPADDAISYVVGADGAFTGTDFLLTDPPLTLPYGSATPITGVPPGASANYQFTDSADAECRAAISVLAPGWIGTNGLASPARPLVSAPALTPAPTFWAIDSTARTVGQTSVPQQGDHILESELIDLSAQPEVRLTATLTAITGTSSGFEVFDSATMQVSIDGAPWESMLGTADTDADGRLTGGVELPVGINARATFNLARVIPAAANSVRFRLIGNSNSPAETLIFSSILIEVPRAAVFVSAPANVQRFDNGPGLADDTISFDVNVTGEYGGTGWTAVGASPAGAPFGPVTLTIPAGLARTSITFADNAFPSAVATLDLTNLPGPWRIGRIDRGAGFAPFFTDAAQPTDPAWVVTGDPPAATMNDGDASGLGEKSLTSETLSLAGVTGPLRFTATLRIRDTSGGFEAADNFLAYLVIDGDPGQQVPLVGPYDLDLSGRMEGAELCPPPAVNPTTQEFTYPLAATVPAGASSVQLVVTGLNDSVNEFTTLTDIQFAPQTAAVDSDGDGITDADEAIMGTSPSNPADALRFTPSPTDPLRMTFPTVAGRFYRVYASSITPGQDASHLQVWRDTGIGIVGDGNPAGFDIVPDAGAPRRFYRLHVKTTDGPWPPAGP